MGGGARNDRRGGGRQKSDTRCETNLKIDKLGVECHNQIYSVVVAAACRATFTLSDTGVIYVTSTQNGKKKRE